MKGTGWVGHHEDRPLGERRLDHGRVRTPFHRGLGCRHLDLAPCGGRGGRKRAAPSSSLTGRHWEVVDSLKFLEHWDITRLSLQRREAERKRRGREGGGRERERGRRERRDGGKRRERGDL